MRLSNPKLFISNFLVFLDSNKHHPHFSLTSHSIPHSVLLNPELFLIKNLKLIGSVTKSCDFSCFITYLPLPPFIPFLPVYHSLTALLKCFKASPLFIPYFLHFLWDFSLLFCFPPFLFSQSFLLHFT